MTARLDRLLQHLGQDVVVHPQFALAHDPTAPTPQQRLRADAVADLYERHVFSALKTVAPDERECIELTYFDGLAIDEIACRVGVTIQVVEERLLHGLEDMVRHLRAHV